jgi:hypothetical protein
MNKYDRELTKAQILAAPKRVSYACAAASFLGLFVALRILLLGTMPPRNSLFFAALMFFNFFFSGMSLIAKRSRLSYVLLVIGATLPLFGSFAYSLTLLVLPITGEWQNDLRSFGTGLFGLAQFTLIIYLFRNLFSKEVLSYVWKQTPSIEPAMAELQT